ncbi:NADH-dependent flavin oxidoreductase [Paenibacillus sp. GCM10023252]|uniref:NADH-dependent flavin oxidoreductase n=1 Tax=Paenibacillus sp. GCM10023252 TaxID=3252649 RepID=UPI00361E4FC3
MKTQYQPLFESYTFKNGLQLGNRIVMAPMTNFAANEDGTVSEPEIAFYTRRCNGVGMVITACTYVSPSGKGFPGEFAADTDEMIPSLTKLASSIKEQGSKAILQMFHGGRACPPELVPGGDVVSASDVPSGAQGQITPRPLTDAEIQDIIRDFGETTRRAIEAGFDGVEIHGANGYLIQQFYSPHTNRREDQWGGSRDNRLAFPLAVVDSVTQAAARYAKEPFLVGYRFSPEEEETPGLTMEDTFALVDALAGKPLDYLHISLNDFESKPRRGADESKTRLQWVQEHLQDRLPLIGVGAIHTPDEAVAAMHEGRVPLVALGRQLIMEPDWVVKVKEGREQQIRTTIARDDQAKLSVPDYLWQAIVHTPGWFPIGD